MTQKSTLAKPGRVDQSWFHVDAEDLILGRLAVEIATVLMGKHKPSYTPHVDTGDFVIVTNASKIRTTGHQKAEDRLYDFFSGYPSGLRRESLATMTRTRPAEVIRLAVKRMLPKSKLGRKMLSKLKVYAGSEHEHAAQQPQPFPREVKKKVD